MDISVVIPVYGCPGAVSELYKRLADTLEGMAVSFEIILVDDRCPKGSWEVIRKLCEEDERVVGIHFSRNFGQQRAIGAGLDKSRGDWVAVMDCDLQDRPEFIKDLYEKAKEGYDVVFARRMNRKDSKLTKWFSKQFYKVYSYFTDEEFDGSINNYSISKRKVIDAYCRMREQHPTYTMFIKWLGFKEGFIDLEEDERFEGKSSYNFRKKVKTAIEIISSQSNKPLYFSIGLGFLMSFVALVTIVILLIKYFMEGEFYTGWPSILASIYFVGGILISVVGITGIYIGNIFDEVKARPVYVIDEILNGKDEEFVEV